MIPKVTFIAGPGLWIDGWEFSQKPLVFIGGYGFPHDVVIDLLGLFRLS
jgi:hypothetical protein